MEACYLCSQYSVHTHTPPSLSLLYIALYSGVLGFLKIRASREPQTEPGISWRYFPRFPLRPHMPICAHAPAHLTRAGFYHRHYFDARDAAPRSRGCMGSRPTAKAMSRPGSACCAACASTGSGTRRPHHLPMSPKQEAGSSTLTRDENAGRIGSESGGAATRAAARRPHETRSGPARGVSQCIAGVVNNSAIRFVLVGMVLLQLVISALAWGRAGGSFVTW